MELTKKQKRALIDILYVAENVSCHDLHHAKKHRHEYTDPCPAEAELQEKIKLIRQLFLGE